MQMVAARRAVRAEGTWVGAVAGPTISRRDIRKQTTTSERGRDGNSGREECQRKGKREGRVLFYVAFQAAEVLRGRWRAASVCQQVLSVGGRVRRDCSWLCSGLRDPAHPAANSHQGFAVRRSDSRWRGRAAQEFDIPDDSAQRLGRRGSLRI